MGAFDQLPLPLKHRRFTAEQYQRMGEIGVLAPNARVELIDGEIIDKAPISSRDWATVNRISLALKKEPTVAETLLLVEVADSSVRYDREVKLPLYAQRGVPEVWIVDLDAKLFRVFRQPRGADYLDAQATSSPGVITLAALADMTVDVGGLFVFSAEAVLHRSSARA